jgi:hypothetical protein
MCNILFIGRASVFVTPCFLCMQIITFPKKVAASCIADSGSADFLFLLYKNDAYKIFGVGCVC